MPFVSNKFFFFENRAVCEKYSGAGQAADYNMAHPHCLPDTWDYIDIPSLCNIHCFPTKKFGYTNTPQFYVIPTYIACFFFHLPVKTLLQFTKVSIHTVHCHTAICGKIECRLLSALVNNPEIQNIQQSF